MKLSEIKGKKAISTLAALMEPLEKIISDGEIKAAIERKDTIPAIAKKLLENRPDEVITVLALLDGEDPKSYEVNLLTLPKKLMEVINDPDVVTLFFSESQTEA